MSLNFSRRTFFRLIPAAALTVASAGVLTACSDVNKPSRTSNGALTVSSVTATVTKNSNSSYTVVLKNAADNDVYIKDENFIVRVTKSDKTYKDYKTTVESDVIALAKNKSATVTVTADGVSASSGDTVTLRYYPRISYESVYASWSYKLS